MTEVRSTIMEFIRENFILGRSDASLDGDESLIEAGIMDSTGVLELVEFLEATYSIHIEDEELVPENLETINNIMAFLKRKGVAEEAGN
ncbi:MAG: acyl carrier protein [Desulfomonilia bacterium]|nr:acyl carrier protein [Desulfomonilia bacterium]